MKFYAELLARLLPDGSGGIIIDGDGSGAILRELAEMRCCRALKEIQDILKDDALTDQDCFQRIERIVCLFEGLGPGGGGRHDFG